MQLIKPAWVSHDEKPIFSIDIHPNGERFATGGQGADSGRVVVWNIAPIFNEDLENDSNTPKQLCQMDNHLACVNVVRWSCDGTLLASGGDDKLVMIWKLAGEGGPSMVFGSSGTVNIEHWRCAATLRGHAGDVLDCAWAPHGAWLATCSVDNSVIIWNSHKFPEMVTTIKGHSGLVKGVAWDPVGKYLASQSDDRSLRVWRTGQWTEEVVVTNPFEECSGTTHVLRLSWSPDGQYLVSAHAMNGGGPTAQIIERDGWKQDKDFVGHRKAVTCVRFNSNILQRQAPGNSKPIQYCCLAIGSRDRSLSVWLTSLKRPLFVIQEIFESSVLDISWSSNGLILMACSWDGTVACIRFDDNELGKRLPSTEKNSLYERLYGKSIESNWSTCSNQMIIEDTRVLESREQLAKKQQVTINSNLEKRVEGASTITTTAAAITTPSPNLLTTPIKAPPDGIRPINKQIETRLPDGKRRITPMFLVAPPTPSKDILKEKPPSLEPQPQPHPQQQQQQQQPQQTIENKFCSSSSEKSTIIIETRNESLPRITIDSDWKKRSPGPRLSPATLTPVTTETRQSLVSVVDNVQALKHSGFKFNLHAINNHSKTLNGTLSRLQFFNESANHLDTSNWETYFGSNVLCISSSRQLIGVGCEDCTLHLLNVSTGGRCLPPFALSSPPISISISQTNRCCVITRNNYLTIWDLWPINDAQIIVQNVPLPQNAVPSSCLLNSSNEPMLILVDGRSYCFKIKLNSWLLLGDPKDPLYRPVTSNPVGDLPLVNAQRSCLSVNRSANNSALASSTSVALTHFELQLANSEVLQSPVEYKYWLLAMVKHLLEKGPEWRLRTILDDLLGPINSSQTWKPDIMGMKKHDLLLQVLELFNSHLKWQRLYMEYFEQIPTT